MFNLRAATCAAMIAMLGAPAYADDLCRKVSQVAMAIMEARQNSEPMAALMGAADMQDEQWRDLTRELVIDAYSRDLRYSQDAKRREINEFGNDSYKNCLRVSG